MRRIEGIALVLSVSMLAACYATSGDSEADTSTSWLQHCAVPTDCAAGSDCVDGWCTMPGADAPSAQSSSPPEQSVTPPEPSSTPPEPSISPIATESGVAGQGDAAGAFFELADVNFENTAAVGWANDHWVVSWVTFGFEAGEPETLHLARVSTAGEVEQHSRPHGVGWPNDVQLTVTAAGGVASSVSGPACGLKVFAPDLQTQTLDASFPCTGDGSGMAATPVPSSADWLIAYGTGAYDEGDHLVGSVFAGRYLADTGTWADGPVELGARTVVDTLGLFAAGQDAVVVWGNDQGATLRSATAMAGPVVPGSPSSWSEPVTLAGAQTISDGGYALANLGEQRLLFSMYGSSLRAHVLGPDGAVTMRDVASSTITDRMPGAAAATELGLAGVCYARGPGAYIGGPLEAGQTLDVESDSMWFVIVGADGTAVTEPVMIADGLADNTGCGVAWSGEHFFAVTWGIFQEVVDNRYTLTRIRGLLVDPTER